MAQQWRTERTMFELGLGEKKNPDAQLSPDNVKWNKMDWDLFKKISGLAFRYADKADKAEAKLKEHTTPKMPAWTREQRAKFVLAWNHKDLTSTELLKVWLADLPQMAKQTHWDLTKIATHLIIGPDNTNPHLKEYCTEKKYRKKVYYVLTKKHQRQSPLTKADLKGVTFTPPK